MPRPAPKDPAHKRPFVNKVAGMELYITSKKNEAALKEDLRKRLAGTVIRELAGEKIEKKTSVPRKKEKVHPYVALRRIPAGKFKGDPMGRFGGDKEIIDFFRRHGGEFSEWNKFVRACAGETKIPPHFIDCRIKTLKEAKLISEINPAKCGGVTKGTRAKKKSHEANEERLGSADLLQQRVLVTKSQFRGLGNQSLIDEYVIRRRNKTPQAAREMEEIKIVFAVQNAGSKKVFPF